MRRRVRAHLAVAAPPPPRPRARRRTRSRVCSHGAPSRGGERRLDRAAPRSGRARAARRRRRAGRRPPPTSTASLSSSGTANGSRSTGLAQEPRAGGSGASGRRGAAGCERARSSARRQRRLGVGAVGAAAAHAKPHAPPIRTRTPDRPRCSCRRARPARRCAWPAARGASRRAGRRRSRRAAPRHPPDPAAAPARPRRLPSPWRFVTIRMRWPRSAARPCPCAGDAGAAHPRHVLLPRAAPRRPRRRRSPAPRTCPSRRSCSPTRAPAGRARSRRAGRRAGTPSAGARGCTPELCGVRDDLAPTRGARRARVRASTQDTEYQREVADAAGPDATRCCPTPLVSRPARSPARVRGGRHDPAPPPDPAHPRRRDRAGGVSGVPADGAAAQALALLRPAVAEER